jgi:hypothetical protein
MSKQPVSKPAVKTPAKKTTTAKPRATTTRKSAPKKLAAPAPSAGGAVVTTVIARYDAGYGNQLFLRGAGAGLSWYAGVPMENVGADRWVWRSPSVTDNIEIKVVLNDRVWAQGENLIIAPGATVTLEPRF